jgi:hypothetical protein
MNHICQESRSCSCSIQGLEPDEDCPLHGYPWPPKCGICGRFLPWKQLDEEFRPKSCQRLNEDFFV